MSPLPISRSALDRLGERLAASPDISEKDYDLLLQVLTAYQAALAEAQERLTRLGFQPTTRVKTTTVLIEKLRREQGMRLKGVQDIAGARIVADVDRSEQDDIVRRIVDEFPDATRPPKVKDRRAEPSAGYRAVHVIVTVQDVPVEIQVRTRRQDEWAQIVEALADKWGRGIRYGDDPNDADSELIASADMTRREFWGFVIDLSEAIDEIERRRDLLHEAEALLQGAPAEVRADPGFADRSRRVAELRRNADLAEAELSEMLKLSRHVAEAVQ